MDPAHLESIYTRHLSFGTFREGRARFSQRTFESKLRTLERREGSLKPGYQIHSRTLEDKTLVVHQRTDALGSLTQGSTRLWKNKD